MTYYIYKGGDNSNAGTREKPLLSVAEALDRVRWQPYERAYFIISGSLTQAASRHGMIAITGPGLPEIFLQAGSAKRPCILSAKGLNQRVMYIGEGNTLSIGENIIIRDGVRKEGGAGIAIDGGKLIMRGGEISNNDGCTGMSGGVYVGKGSEFIMEGGLITRNKTKMHGGGVFPDDGGVFILRGGTIAYNEAAISGGGVFVGPDAEFIMSGGSIEKNLAGGELIVAINNVVLPYGYGGGVAVSEQARFIMQGGAISRNRAFVVEPRGEKAGSGGGVAVEKDGAFILDQGCIAGNDVRYWGGGVYSEGELTIMPESIIRDNHADLGGGGVTARGSQAVFTMHGGLLMNNTTGGTGGAIHVRESASCMIQKGLIAQNIAGEAGNALAIDGEVIVNGGIIGDNEAASFVPDEEEKETAAASWGTHGIAIVIEDSGKLILQGGQIDGNIVKRDGGQVEDRRLEAELLAAPQPPEDSGKDV
ncbi:MAG: hypothetical protein LBE17_13680 [Treponema sp.]|nr:hypothetical protein [Treponema sp.]